MRRPHPAAVVTAGIVVVAVAFAIGFAQSRSSRSVPQAVRTGLPRCPIRHDLRAGSGRPPDRSGDSRPLDHRAL